MITIVKTDVKECEVKEVLIFDSVRIMAWYITKEYKLTPEECEQIETAEYACVIPSKSNYKLENLHIDMDYPSGTFVFEVVRFRRIYMH